MHSVRTGVLALGLSALVPFQAVAHCGVFLPDRHARDHHAASHEAAGGDRQSSLRADEECAPAVVVVVFTSSRTTEPWSAAAPAMVSAPSLWANALIAGPHSSFNCAEKARSAPLPVPLRI